MARTIAVILGGGRGTRLFPLTAYRSKPAVPLGGKYRLVDIPISNCLNSGIRDIYVLTQFNSVSLNRHVTSAYRLDPFSSGTIEILAAQQTLTDSQWYQGTADAVRQNLRHFLRSDASEILILAGDQLYQMDFREIVRFHRERQADITISALAVRREAAPSLGILRTDREGRILRFAEKPTDERLLDKLAIDPAVQAGEWPGQPPDPTLTHVASMGIYVFQPHVLGQMLQESEAADFGKEVIPRSISAARVYAFLFSGYWEDIGTIEAFHRANLALASPTPPIDFYTDTRRVFTHARFLPASRVHSCSLRSSLLADGCVIEEAVLEQAVVGVRMRIGHRTVIRRSVLMGADFFETGADRAENERLGRPHMGIGDDCIIENAIIDKNARIGHRVRVTNSAGVRQLDAPNHFIRDGIVIIPKGAIVPDGARI